MVPVTECETIKPTGDGYAIVKKQVSSSEYYISFYNAAGKKIPTVKTFSYSFTDSVMGHKE